MDIFKQRRFLIFLVVLLVVLNLGTITLLWLGRPAPPPPVLNPGNSGSEHARLEALLKKELKFDGKQIKQYFQLREKHRQQLQQLNREIRKLKKQMFDAVFSKDPQPTLSDSLLNLSLQKQAELEQLTYRHFLELKKLCDPNQQNQLKLLVGEFFRQQNPRKRGRESGPAGNFEDKNPPPPDDGRHPLPPPGR